MRLRHFDRLRLCLLLPLLLGLMMAWGGAGRALPASVLAGAQRTYCVSPSGSDSNPGTVASPWLTLDHARTAIETYEPAMTGDIVVLLRGGTYALTSTLAFTASDSGKNGHNVVWQAYPGEIPILSGGRVITGWTVDSGSVYKATAASLSTRNLFVGGVRCVRARSLTVPAGITQTGTGYTWPDSSLAAYAHPEDLEFVYRSAWTENRLPVASVSGTTVTMASAPFAAFATNSYTPPTAGTLKYIENARELLTVAGQFYNNTHTNTLYYQPRAGETMGTTPAVAPTLERLLTVTGAAGAQASNITFRGLRFEYSTWLSPLTNGLNEIQANVYFTTTTEYDNRNVQGHRPPAAVEVSCGSNVTFDGCVFAHLGAAGLTLCGGTTDSAVRGCVFADIGGNGVQVGDPGQPHPSDTRLVDRRDTLDNCLIHDCGQEYRGACGVIAWWTDALALTHNTLYSLPYTAISVGWGWGDYPTTPAGALTLPSCAQNNVVRANLIYNGVQSLNDGAGVYLNSVQPGLLCVQNVVHDIPTLNSGPGGANNSGLYSDDGARYMAVRGNVVYNTGTYSLHTNDNMGDNTLAYNTFDAGTWVTTGLLNGANGASANSVHDNYTGGAANDPSVAAAAGLQAAYLYLTGVNP